MRERFFGALMFVALVSTFAVAVGKYEFVKTVSVPGAGGWDYVTVDQAGRRVSISHSIQVDVLDADVYTVLGTIPNTPVFMELPWPQSSAAAMPRPGKRFRS